jgi:hypothetical protein
MIDEPLPFLYNEESPYAEGRGGNPHSEEDHRPMGFFSRLMGRKTPDSKPIPDSLKKKPVPPPLFESGEAKNRTKIKNRKKKPWKFRPF